MNAAETSASRAIADWTPLAVVSRSLTTAEIDTFMSDVSTTSTNIAIASSNDSRGLPTSSGLGSGSLSIRPHPLDPASTPSTPSTPVLQSRSDGRPVGPPSPSTTESGDHAVCLQ